MKKEWLGGKKWLKRKERAMKKRFIVAYIGIGVGMVICGGGLWVYYAQNTVEHENKKEEEAVLVFTDTHAMIDVPVLIESSAVVGDVAERTEQGQTLSKCVTPEHKKIAILDLGDFITEDTQQIIRKIGVAKMASYTLTHWRNPIDSCLDALEKMGGEDEHKSPVLFTYKKRRMPDCIVAWQQGECPHQEVRSKLLLYIEKIDKNGFFSSKKEREMTQAIIEIAFDPAQISAISKPIPAMIKLAQELKGSGYLLYAIANVAQEAHAYIEKAYPEIIALFDGIVASHQIRALKNDKKLFDHLFERYNLNPTQCVLIDKEEGTVKVAQAAGMTGIQFTQQKNLRNMLKKQGVL